jgi:hypothetical protein
MKWKKGITDPQGLRDIRKEPDEPKPAETPAPSVPEIQIELEIQPILVTKEQTSEPAGNPSPHCPRNSN